MIHKTEIEGYSFDELAQTIGDLRYDALATLLSKIATKIQTDGEKDASRGRKNLADCLFQTASSLEKATKHIENAWVICEPFTK